MITLFLSYNLWLRVSIFRMLWQIIFIFCKCESAFPILSFAFINVVKCLRVPLMWSFFGKHHFLGDLFILFVTTTWSSHESDFSLCLQIWCPLTAVLSAFPQCRVLTVFHLHPIQTDFRHYYLSFCGPFTFLANALFWLSLLQSLTWIYPQEIRREHSYILCCVWFN